MPGVNIGWNNQAYVIGVNASVGGYYFLEVDDDVPRNRGYGRGGLRNETSAASVQVYTRIDVGENADLSISAQQWHDGNDWLENKYVMAFTYNAKRWLEGGSWFEGGACLCLILSIRNITWILMIIDQKTTRITFLFCHGTTTHLSELMLIFR